MSYQNAEIAAQKTHMYHRVLLILAGASVFMILYSIAAGRYHIPLPDVVRIILNEFIPQEPTWDPKAQSIIFSLRIPRSGAAFLVGGALSLSGITYQSVFKNPLVSPDLLGISSGACVGAAAAILLGMNAWGIQALAFVMGILAVVLTVLAPRILKNSSMTMLVLSGIVVSGIMNSLLGLLKYIADPETQLAAITYWQLGSMTKVMMADLIYGFPMLLIGTVALLLMRWKLNVLSLGDHEAQMLGVNIRLMRTAVIICATMLTAVSVSLCGTVGWVGLVIPHVSRMLVGDDNSRSLPVAYLLGGLFLLIIDTLARTITKAEIPLSVLTGIIGAPFYYFVLIKQRMKLT